MTGTSDRSSGTAPHGRTPRAVITDAQTAASLGQARRQKRYAITMAFRTACFVCMIFVPGVFRWILFGGAVFLPYIAVLFANQVDSRTETNEVEHGEPTSAPQLPGPVEDPEIIAGTVVEDDDIDEDYDDRQERRSA